MTKADVADSLAYIHALLAGEPLYFNNAETQSMHAENMKLL